MLNDDLRGRELGFRFRSAAERYQIIRDDQNQIVVPYKKGREFRDHLTSSADVDYAFLRSVQRFTVGVHDNLLRKMIDRQIIFQHDCGLWVLIGNKAYTDEKGLSPEAVGIDSGILVQ